MVNITRLLLGIPLAFGLSGCNHVFTLPQPGDIRMQACDEQLFLVFGTDQVITKDGDIANVKYLWKVDGQYADNGKNFTYFPTEADQGVHIITLVASAQMAFHITRAWSVTVQGREETPLEGV